MCTFIREWTSGHWRSPSALVILVYTQHPKKQRFECVQVCGCRGASEVTVQSPRQSHSTFGSESGSFINLLAPWLTKLVWRWSAQNVSFCTWLSRGCWGLELRSSFLFSKHFTPLSTEQSPWLHTYRFIYYLIISNSSEGRPPHVTCPLLRGITITISKDGHSHLTEALPQGPLWTCLEMSPQTDAQNVRETKQGTGSNAVDRKSL